MNLIDFQCSKFRCTHSQCDRKSPTVQYNQMYSVHTVSATLSNQQCCTFRCTHSQYEPFSVSVHYSQCEPFSLSVQYSQYEPFSLSVHYSPCEPFSQSVQYSQYEPFSLSVQYSQCETLSLSVQYSQCERKSKQPHLYIFCAGFSLLIVWPFFQADKKNKMLPVSFTIIGQCHRSGIKSRFRVGEFTYKAHGNSEL